MTAENYFANRLKKNELDMHFRIQLIYVFSQNKWICHTFFMVMKISLFIENR